MSYIHIIPVLFIVQFIEVYHNYKVHTCLKLLVYTKLVTNELLLYFLSILTAFPPLIKRILYDVCNVKLQFYVKGFA